MINSISNFFYMGGYGDYVWSAYGIAAVVIIGILISTLRWEKKVLGKSR